ncbi:MAG: PEP-CTERM sorting domain-containing protein [candidate division Zixibacteria bacterium]|nr:PEP-CTERM sorting domain-containing protein [candidate division Zixibacteria bacterium]
MAAYYYVLQQHEHNFIPKFGNMAQRLLLLRPEHIVCEVIMIRRARIDRESKEMVKLIGIAFLTIILYLCLSFSNAYGYQISNSDRIRIENPNKIDWDSDSWLLSNVNYNSVNGSFFDNTPTDMTGFDFMDDGHSSDDKVVPAIPEPAITILFGLGLGSMALYRRIRR